MSAPPLPGDEDDSTPDPEGASLAAQLFQMAQAKGVSLEDGDLLDDDYDDDLDEEEEDDDEEDDDDDDDVPNIPQGAIDAYAGDKLAAGQNDLTNDKLYSEMKERVLDTAGGFVDMVSGVSEDDDDDDDDDNDKTKPYVPPSTVPDPELTAGEVVLLVLDALKNNDTPSTNKGVEILFGFSSSGSQIKNEKGLTTAEYGSFLKDTGYEALFNYLDVKIEKGEYSHNGKKGYFTARLQTGALPKDSISCNFILSAEEGNNEDENEDNDFWLIDSIMIRPQSMRRRRRK